MTFLHPLWLGAVLPWALLVAYLLRRGIARSIEVPFLALWPADALPLLSSAKKRSLPPWPIVLVLMALLLAILAAAGPARTVAIGEVTIIVDRGLTMSVRSDVDALLDAVDQQLHAKHVRLMLVPGDVIDTDRRGWRALVKQAGPTAVDTTAAVRQTVMAARQRADDPVIVISDVPLATDAKTIEVSPSAPLSNLGIATFAISDGIYPQAMVRLRNRSTARSGKLTIGGAVAPITQAIDLPPPGEDRDLFIDLPAPLTATIKATLSAEHTSPLNDRAWAVRSSAGPLRWSTLGDVPVAMKKMVDVYNRLRPSRDARVAIVQNDDHDHSGDGVWLVPARSPGDLTAPAIVPDRLTADIRAWPAVADAEAAPPAGWRVLVRRGSSTLVAERPSGGEVWVNADLESWARTPDFVVFFAHVFDAIGGGGLNWTSEPPHPPLERPGVYATPTGAVAINAPPLPAREKVSSGSLDRLRGAASGSSSTTPWLIAAASVLITVGVVMGVWRDRHQPIASNNCTENKLASSVQTDLR